MVSPRSVSGHLHVMNPSAVSSRLSRTSSVAAWSTSCPSTSTAATPTTRASRRGLTARRTRDGRRGRIPMLSLTRHRRRILRVRVSHGSMCASVSRERVCDANQRSERTQHAQRPRGSERERAPAEKEAKGRWYGRGTMCGTPQHAEKQRVFYSEETGGARQDSPARGGWGAGFSDGPWSTVVWLRARELCLCAAPV